MLTWEASIDAVLILICASLWFALAHVWRRMRLVHQKLNRLIDYVLKMERTTYEDPTIGPPEGHEDIADLDVESAMTDFTVPGRGLDDNVNEA